MRALIITFFLCSVACADEIDSFEGLKSEKKDGVIIIDYAPGANKAALKREAERSGKKAKQQWKKVHVQQSYDKVKEALNEIGSQHKTRTKKRSSSSPTYRTKDSSQYYKETYEKRLREIKAEERRRSYNKYEWAAKERKKQRYKDKLKDIEANPEDY